MEFTGDEVVIEKEPSELDALVIDVTGVLDDVDIEYAVVVVTSPSCSVVRERPRTSTSSSRRSTGRRRAG